MKKLLIFAAMCCLLLSCTKQEIPTDERIPINISVDQLTKVNDQSYENDDRIGVFVVNYDNSTPGSLSVSNNHVNNIGFTYTGNSWTPDETIYWKDKKTSADFYVYYPYDSELGSTDEYIFSVDSDQNKNGLGTSDFLWGKASNVTPTSSAVPIVTNHVLSRMVINIKSIDGSSDNLEIESVTISGLKTAATIDLSTGTATATGEPKDIIPFKDNDGSYKAMVIPQEIAESSKLVTIRVGGVNYVYKKAISFNENTQHNFDITVSKTGINADITIGKWDEDDADQKGVATEEEIELPTAVPSNQIWYTATDKITSFQNSDFNANLISNEYESEQGILTFSSPLSSIAASAFQNCTLLTSIKIPNGITIINSLAFSGCTNLSDITLPDSITSIKGGTFTDCSSLTIITLPEELTEIGTNAFYGCLKLKKVICKASSAPSINNTNIFDPQVDERTLVVPKGSKQSYETSEWKNYFPNIIEME